MVHHVRDARERNYSVNEMAMYPALAQNEGSVAFLFSFTFRYFFRSKSTWKKFGKQLQRNYTLVLIKRQFLFFCGGGEGESTFRSSCENVIYPSFKLLFAAKLSKQDFKVLHFPWYQFDLAHCPQNNKCNCSYCALRKKQITWLL